MLDFRDLSDTNSFVSEQGVIPAFGILDIFILALVARQISLGSYFGLHGFSVSILLWISVIDLYGFPVIFLYRIPRSIWGLDSDGTSPDSN